MSANNTFTVKDVLFFLLNNLKMIFAVTLASELAFLLTACFIITPLYQSNALLIINASSKATQPVTNDDLTLSQKLVDTYAIILKGDTILSNVISKLHLPYSEGQLAGEITVTGVGSTEILELSVTDSSPDRAKAIANGLVALAPSEIKRTVKAGSVEVIAPAQRPGKPVSPNIPLFMVAGVLSGFACACIIAFIREWLNNKIKSMEDIESKLGFAVIGIIPDVGRISE